MYYLSIPQTLQALGAGVLPPPEYDDGAIPWTVAIDGRAYGQAVPEPGTFVLLGLGLLGFCRLWEKKAFLINL